jgi:hypothetical protein
MLNKLATLAHLLKTKNYREENNNFKTLAKSR